MQSPCMQPPWLKITAQRGISVCLALAYFFTVTCSLVHFPKSSQLNSPGYRYVITERPRWHHYRKIVTPLSQSVNGYIMDDSISISATPFEHLRAVVSSLGLQNARLIPSNYDRSKQEQEGEMMDVNSVIIPIKSLIFELIWIPSPSLYDSNRTNERVDILNKDYIVVILEEDKMVDLNKLSDVIIQSKDIIQNLQYKTQLQTLRLVPTSLLSNITGFEAGTIPPIGHYPHTLITLVDNHLLLHKNQNPMLLGGSGNVHYQMLLRLESLTNYYDISKSMLVDNPRISNDKMVKPYFPLCPPPRPLGHDESKNISSPNLKHHPVTVTFVGRLRQVRQIAKTLAFCDIAPIPMIHPEQREEIMTDEMENSSNHDLPWLSGSDGQDMGVQIIIGKTLCSTLGDVEGAKAIKALKVGQELVVTGNINILTLHQDQLLFAHPSSSMTNWVEKRCLDISVVSFVLLPKRYKYNRPVGSFAQNINGVSNREDPHTKTASLQSPVDRPLLNMEHIFGPSFSIELINSSDSIASFAQTVRHLLSDPTHYDLVGLDCEWQPSGLYSSSIEENPVALLQVCFYSQQKMFLLDLLSLLRHHQKKESTMNTIETDISSILVLLFQSRSLFKVGFQIASDLRRLASSFPHLKVFQEVDSVVELSNIARKMIQKSNPSLSRTDIASLRRLCINVLGFDLSKTEQISNWARRPLTAQQIQYASLDSAVSPHILQTLLCTGLNRHHSATSLLLNKDYSSFVSSWRFTVFTSGNGSDEANVYLIINHLKASRVTGDSYVVTQSWITGHTPLNPPSFSANSFVDKGGVLRVLPHSIQLFDQKANHEWIEKLLASRELRLTSKDKCLNILLKQSYSASVQPGIYRDAKLDYNTRSGYVELQDSVVIFVNMPKVELEATSSNPFWQRYPNTWRNNGRVLTWYLREYEWDNGKTKLAQKLLSTSGLENSAHPGATTLLFIRYDRNDYSFYGRCSVFSPKTLSPARSDSLVQLYLHLNDFDLLYEHVDRPEAVFDNSTAITPN